MQGEALQIVRLYDNVPFLQLVPRKEVVIRSADKKGELFQVCSQSKSLLEL